MGTCPRLVCSSTSCAYPTLHPDAHWRAHARARREVFILEDLKDANIVQFLGACFEEGSTMLVTGAPLTAWPPSAGVRGVPRARGSAAQMAALSWSRAVCPWTSLPVS